MRMREVLFEWLVAGATYAQKKQSNQHTLRLTIAIVLSLHMCQHIMELDREENLLSGRCLFLCIIFRRRRCFLVLFVAVVAVSTDHTTSQSRRQGLFGYTKL